MSLLDKDLMNHDHLDIRSYVGIGLGSLQSIFSQNALDQTFNLMYSKIEKEYAGEDLVEDHQVFYSIYNDIVWFFTDSLVELGCITSCARDSIVGSARRLTPYFGTPESPGFYMYASISFDFGATNHTGQIVLINKCWETQWRDVDPTAYDRFIKYITPRWKPELQACHNPDPWKTLQEIIDHQIHIDLSNLRKC